MDQRVSKESKLDAAKAIVASYAKNSNTSLSPDELCDVFKKVFATIDETLPAPDKGRVGLA